MCLAKYTLFLWIGGVSLFKKLVIIVLSSYHDIIFLCVAG
jgi:hypothetical protein